MSQEPPPPRFAWAYALAAAAIWAMAAYDMLATKQPHPPSDLAAAGTGCLRP